MGLFIFDFLNPEQVARGLVEQEVKEAGGYTFIIHRRIADGWIEKSIQYADPNGEHQHHVERVGVVARWLASAPRACGLRHRGHYGDYALAPWREDAPRSILVARKIPCG